MYYDLKTINSIANWWQSLRRRIGGEYIELENTTTEQNEKDKPAEVLRIVSIFRSDTELLTYSIL